MHVAQTWKPWLSALIAAVIGLGGEQLVERFQREQIISHEREHVANVLAGLRARLEGVISGNLLSVRALGAVIAAQPDLDQAGFNRMAGRITSEDHALRNVAGAPNLVIRLMYPLAGNEAAVGLDYRAHPTQREAALKAVESGKTVIAGPLELVQGGFALIARHPVFVPAEEAGAPARLWGLVSAAMEVERLADLAGVREVARESDIEIAIRGRDGLGAAGGVFYGDAALFSRSPVLVGVSLPTGSWQLGAVPVVGWASFLHGDTVWVTRLLGLFLALTFAGLAYVVTRRTQMVRHAAAKLRESQALFRGFMDNLPAGAFVKDPGVNRVLFENRWLGRYLSDVEDGCGAPGAYELHRLRDGPQQVHSETKGHDGEVMICETLRFLLGDGRGRELIGGVVTDITARVNAERALTESRARLTTLLNTLPDLVWMKDPDGVFLACNARFATFFGALEKDIVGKTDHDFLQADLADALRSHDIAAIDAAAPKMNEERVRFASDGHEELLETIRAPVRDEQGELMGVLGIARDITERDAMNRELRDKISELIRWQGVILDREDRVQALKREVNLLLRELDQPPRYDSVREDE